MIKKSICYLRYFSLFFLLWLFLVFAPCFICKAQAMPEINSATFELITGGLETLTNNFGLQYGVLPLLPDGMQNSINSVLGTDTRLTVNDFHIRPLSDIELENLNEGFTRHFYDSNGNEIAINDLYYVEGNNGFYRTEFYIDSDGNILFADAEHNNVLYNCGLVNSGLADLTNVNFNSWDDLLLHLASEIKSNNFNYTLNDVSITSQSYFLFFGTTRGGSPATASWMFIPNQYNYRVIVPVVSEDGQYINKWYANNLDCFVFKSVLGNYNVQITEGLYSKDGAVYRYQVSINNGLVYGGGTVIDYQSFINGNTSSLCFGREGIYYDHTKNTSSEIFAPIDTEEVPQIDTNELYDYNELSLYVPEEQPVNNPNYNPSSPIEPNNFPYYYPYNENLPSLNPSSLPLPGSNPGINPIPGIGSDSIVDIGPNIELPEIAPLVDNLKDRFPFSIPWDIYRMFKMLQSERSVPVLEFEITFPIINYTWDCTIDLSMFDGIASLFRKCVLILFIVSLAVYSYNRHFGS